MKTTGRCGDCCAAYFRTHGKVAFDDPHYIHGVIVCPHWHGNRQPITDEHGQTVAVGVLTPFNSDEHTVSVAVIEDDDSPPTPVITLRPEMAIRLARELPGPSRSPGHHE